MSIVKRVKHKGKEIVITCSQGNGEYETPMTNCPYSWEVWENGVKIDEHYHCSSDADYCLDTARLCHFNETQEERKRKL